MSADRSAARRGRPGYDRDQVLAAAIDLFNTHGFDATSVADLAARLGVTKSALYHHFASKDALLEVALGNALDGLEGVLSEATSGAASASEQVRQIVRGAVRVLTDELPSVTLLLRVRGNSEIERAALARRRAYDHALADVVAAAQREGMIRSDIDATVATRLLFGMINSLVEWYRPDGAVDADELAEDILRMTLEGLQP